MDGEGVVDGVAIAGEVEELGEVARAALELDNNQLQVELVQLAAVAVAWLEGM